MTTALITADKFISLSGAEDSKAAMQALKDSGESFSAQDLIRISTPLGGATNWQVPGPTGDESRKELVGALVHWEKCGILWPSEEMNEGQQPVLRSWDMIVGEQVGPIPDDMAEALAPFKMGGAGNLYQISESSGFPYAQWGSGKGGSGKRLKEQRHMFVLPVDALAPYLVVAQPGSLATVTKWFKQLVQTAKVPWWRVMVRLTLQKVTNRGGQVYSQIVPETAGILDAETADKLRSTWGTLLARVARETEPVQN